ncbi:MAG: pyruvate kinase [Lachnospiraceae bacterium]|jgi:pyruvate kinase|nr:pyruvate kinase [Lachnospiraceae bacterium]
MRKTKIICTIGPVSQSEEKLKELILAGMNVARFNFSHGGHEEHKGKYERAVKAAKDLGMPLATMLDTKGPEIRLRDFEGGKQYLESGNLFRLTTDEILGTAERASISYKNLKNDISVGTTILIDDGLIEMTVKAIEETDIVCEVINGGYVSNHKGINVPGVVLSMPYISEVDREDILFGVKMGYDYLAASFVRCREDVEAVRKLITDNGGKMKIISKIENMQGIDNIDEILEVSDGIMVARGDMGVEVPMEEVPILQKELIQKTIRQGKIVITATQMLDSMMKNPRPTRAETTDVANAIYDGTTAIMLSGESAAGAYPIESVQTMSRIAERTEQEVGYEARFHAINYGCEVLDNREDVTTAISHACCATAMDLKASAIITVTMSGFTANKISRYQPECMVIGCTVDESVYRQLSLLFGVMPLLIQKEDDTEKLFDAAINASLEAGLIHHGDRVVLTAGVPLGVAGNTNMIRVVEV